MKRGLPIPTNASISNAVHPSTKELSIFRGAPACGFSRSSSYFALRSAIELWYADRQAPLMEVLKRTLAYEAARAGGRRVGAADAVPIIFGGVMGAATSPDGQVRCKKITCNHSLLEQHLVWSYNPAGKKHFAPKALENLFHLAAKEHVRKISGLANDVERFPQRDEIQNVAECVNEYRREPSGTNIA